MKNENKFSIYEMAGLVVIVLILLYLPCKMTTEKQQDKIANSYYHDGQ